MTAQAHAGALALAREAALLVELNGLATPDRLQVAVAPVAGQPGRARAQLIDDLVSVDGLGRTALQSLTQAGAHVSPDIQQTLGALSAENRARIDQSQPIGIDAELYLRSLDQLLHADGAGTGQPPDPARIASSLATLAAGKMLAPGAGTPQTPLSSGSANDDGGGVPIWGIAVLAVLMLGGIAFAVSRRTAPSLAGGHTVSPPGSRLGGASTVGVVSPDAPVNRPPSLAPSGPDVRDLLEVSRRLTAAAASGDIDRAVIRDALQLVPAKGAALIRQEGDELSVLSESHPGMLVPERLGDGLVRRVAETGQPLVQVSATEPAIRNLPASLAAVPLVGGGRVESVLLLIRDGNQPFTQPERDLLQSLAPVAAAALHNARQTRAAIEDSLIDPLTAVGNRRRLDTELPKALAGPGPTSLFIVDLDHFKPVNDIHGHQAGDALLKGVAALLRDTVRPGDSVYRYGGEEFCVVMRETPLPGAIDVAERVRTTLEAKAFSIGKADALSATASFGVSTSTDTDAAALIARADAALYEAKEAGRNRVHAR